jgi:hypothetical protein
VGKFVDTRGKIATLSDQLYVSPYLLRPLRRLEEVERQVALDKAARRKRAASGGKEPDPARGQQTAPSAEK